MVYKFYVRKYCLYYTKFEFQRKIKDLLHLIENTFDRKRIYANPSSYPNSNPNTNPNPFGLTK